MDGSAWEIRLDEPVGWVRHGEPDVAGVPELHPLRAAYDLGTWLEWGRSPGAGSDRHFFFTTSTGDFAARVSPAGRSVAALRFEARLIDHLDRSGFPAPAVVSTRAGESFHVAGWSYLVTRRPARTAYQPGNPVHARAAGEILARYHDVVRSFPDRFRAQGCPVLYSLEKNGPPALEAFTDLADGILGPVDRKRLSRATSYLWPQFIRVPEGLAGLLPDLRRLVVHGSFTPDALVFAGDAVAGMAGYGRAAYDVRALDLAAVAKHFAPSGAVGLDVERCADIMAAYGEEEDVPAAEVSAMPLVLRAERLGRVLRETSAILRSGAACGEEQVLAVLDVAELEAERLRWLEQGEHDVLAAFGSSRVRR